MKWDWQIKLEIGAGLEVFLEEHDCTHWDQIWREKNQKGSCVLLVACSIGSGWAES